MRFFVSGPRILNIRTRVRPEDKFRVYGRRPPFFLPTTTNLAFLSLWLAVVAFAIFQNQDGPYALHALIVLSGIAGIVISAVWALLTVVCAILRRRRRFKS